MMRAGNGVEIRLPRDGTQYRLGAERHTVDDDLDHMADAGFAELRFSEHAIMEDALPELPNAAR